MRPTLGFVLATYDQPEQTLFLCERLSDMFGAPPIVVHHDFSQCDLIRSAFPENVSFVEAWHRTGWGSLSVVEAQLAALEQLYTRSDPHWFTFLSTADYPIQMPERILHDLRSAEVDAFIDLQPVQNRGGAFLNRGLGAEAFQHPQFRQNAYNRYVAVPWMPRFLARRIPLPIETWVCRSKSLVKHLTPFGGEVACYAGDHWFTGNRRIAALLTTRTDLWRELHRHYRKKNAPEESFCHTLIGNTPGVHTSSNNLRYSDWTGCYAHPRTLLREDFPRLLQSQKHFARKFPWDPELLHSLDQLVLARAAGVIDANGLPARARMSLATAC